MSPVNGNSHALLRRIRFGLSMPLRRELGGMDAPPGTETQLKATFVHRTPTTRLHGRTQIPFVSMCPRCAQMRPQPHYDRNSLLRLLGGGYPLEAYCSMCDEFWSISARERAKLVAVAVASGAGIAC